MSAFIIAHSTVKDPDIFQTYAQAVGPTLAPFGGEVVLKGKVAAVLDGDHPFQNVGALRFPDRAAALGWYESDDYQALIAIREKAADMTLVVYDVS